MLYAARGSCYDAAMFFLRYLLFAFFAFIVATVAAFVYLTWWQALLVSAGTMFVLVRFGGWYLRIRLKGMARFASQLIQGKSGVLRGAAVEVHSVTPSARPGPRPEWAGEELNEEEGEEPRADLAYYRLDVTIIPGGTAGAFQHWDLDDLRVVPSHAPPPPALEGLAEGLDNSPETDEDFEDVSLEEIEIEEGGRFVPVEVSKFCGPQRIRALIGVVADWKEVKFRYYFEDFGRVALPRRRLE